MCFVHYGSKHESTSGFLLNCFVIISTVEKQPANETELKVGG